MLIKKLKGGLSMEKYLFMKPLLQRISEGSFFKKIFSIILNIAGVIIALVGLVSFVKMWKFIFELSPSGILGGIIFQLFLLIGIYMLVHILIIRAKEIDNLPESEFTVIPIVSIFLKMIGELYASFISIISVGVGILFWFAGWYAGDLFREIFNFIPSFMPKHFGLILQFGDEPFVQGLLVVIGGFFNAFFTLVFFYLLSEGVVVLVNMARDMRMIRQIAEKSQERKAEENV